MFLDEAIALKNQLAFKSSIWPSLPIWIHSFIDFPLERKEMHTDYLRKGWHGRKVLNWISWNLGFSSAIKKQVIQLPEPQFCKEKKIFFLLDWLNCVFKNQFLSIMENNIKNNVYLYLSIYQGFPGRWLTGKESTCQERDAGSLCGLGKSPEEGIINPL